MHRPIDPASLPDPAQQRFEATQAPASYPSLQQFVDILPEHIVLVEPSGLIVLCNKAWIDFFQENGGPRGVNFIGYNYLAACEAGEPGGRATQVREGIKRVLDGENHFELDYPCDGPDGPRWFNMVVRPLVSEPMRLAMIAHRNITASKHAIQAALGANNLAGNLQQTVLASNDGIVTTDLVGRITSWNDVSTIIFGYDRSEVIGRSFSLLLPDAGDRALARRMEAIVSQPATRAAVERLRKDRNLIEVDESALVIKSEDGKLMGVSFIYRERSLLENEIFRARIVNGELVHRMKNLIAVICALIRQTSSHSSSVDDYRQTLTERVLGLASSTSILKHDSHASVLAVEFVETCLIRVLGSNSRISLAIQPDLLINEKAVQSVGMALHELATNTLKYGAMSEAGGSVRITTEIIPQNMPCARLKWEEAGASIRANPARSGFGTEIISTVLGRSLQCEVQYRIENEAVYWHVDMPIPRLAEFQVSP